MERLSKSTMVNLENWRKQRRSKMEDIDNIVISNKVHLNSSYDGEFKISYSGRRRFRPIVVRESEGKYELIFGFNQYMAMKNKGFSKVPITIVKFSREELINFVNHIYVRPGVWNKPIGLIEVPNVFLESEPSQHKIDKKKSDILTKGIKPILISRKGNKLRDGYITYLLVLELGLTHIPVCYREEFRKEE